MAQLPDELAARVRAFFGARVEVHGEAATTKAVEALADAEAARRGEPDPVSGALHGLALTQGSLMKREYDLSTHGHHEGWDVGAVIVDIQRLIRVNMAHGFAAGDAALRQVAQTLMNTFPTARVVRQHPDAFCVLLPPSAEVPLTSELRAQTLEALRTEGPAGLDYTVALLQLTLQKPSHWQVLGPLIWAECERALTQVSRGHPGEQILRRVLQLDAAIS